MQKLPIPSRISICMPNRNNLRYLPARLDSICRQSFANWELIVVDACSNDGAWDYLVEMSKGDSRIRIHQESQEGIYAGINSCIRKAQSEFVYIAPSDDVMSLDCLEKLLMALESRPDCDLAHCPLLAIGDDATTVNNWWPTLSLFALATKNLLDRPHIRRAPFDGLLHLYGETVYTSLTQLLIRRSLFERIGLFDGQWGSIGDFHWGLRAAMVANTVHVPNTWGGWRIHSAQASNAAGIGTPGHRQKIEEMIHDAVRRVWTDIPAPIQQGLSRGWQEYFMRLDELMQEFKLRPNRISRNTYLLAQLLMGSTIARTYTIERVVHKRKLPELPSDVVKRWIRSVDDTEYLVQIESDGEQD